jgi:hypothetical protein
MARLLPCLQGGWSQWKPSFRLTPPLQHRLALADEASELHHEELETASRFVSMMIIATAWSSTDR